MITSLVLSTSGIKHFGTWQTSTNIRTRDLLLCLCYYCSIEMGYLSSSHEEALSVLFHWCAHSPTCINSQAEAMRSSGFNICLIICLIEINCFYLLNLFFCVPQHTYEIKGHLREQGCLFPSTARVQENKLGSSNLVISTLPFKSSPEPGEFPKYISFNFENITTPFSSSFSSFQTLPYTFLTLIQTHGLFFN